MITYFHTFHVQPDCFHDLLIGDQTFDIRRNDRDYKFGDVLVYRESVSGIFTGREVYKYITHVLHSDFIKQGYVGLSLTDYLEADVCYFDSSFAVNGCLS